MDAQEFKKRIVDIVDKEKESIICSIEDSLKNHTGMRGMTGGYEISIKVRSTHTHSGYIDDSMREKGFTDIKVTPFGFIGLVESYKVSFKLPQQGE